jgi:hypothetical protein
MVEELLLDAARVGHVDLRMVAAEPVERGRGEVDAVTGADAAGAVNLDAEHG